MIDTAIVAIMGITEGIKHNRQVFIDGWHQATEATWGTVYIIARYRKLTVYIFTFPCPSWIPHYVHAWGTSLSPTSNHRSAALLR